jgi:uncharacterized protein
VQAVALSLTGRARTSLALLVCVLIAAATLPGLALAQTFPALTGRVVDAANVIPPDEEARLTDKLAALETQTHRQLVVATIASLEDYDINDYANRLFRTWQLGDKARNDGVLLLVAPKEHKLRIEVGYGLEGVLTDGLSSLVINQTIVPRFKAGDMAGGIEAGADAIIQQLKLPDAEAQKLAADANAEPEQSVGGAWPVLIWIGLFLFLTIMPRFARRQKAYRMSHGLAPILVWNVLSAIKASGGSSSGGGWSSGGGGFSGGGGSSGGGGASGGW